MAEAFHLSANSISTLATYLPPDLTMDQSEEALTAARNMAEVVWREATASAIATRVYRSSFEDAGVHVRVHDTLAYLDKTIDNVVDVPDSKWRSDEVVTMLRELRAYLVPNPSGSGSDS